MEPCDTRQIAFEKLRWMHVPHAIFECALTIMLLFVPKHVCLKWLRRRIARDVYRCAESEVFLYKSGRAALRGLMEALGTARSQPRVALIPDYVCNVVKAACLASGFETKEYPTDVQCLPNWNALDALMQEDEAPVVVFCSLFGSVPLLTREAKDFEQAHPDAFIVADECQNMVERSSVTPRLNRAVVFSFNDKTCPGLMGGGVVCPQASGVLPSYRKAPLSRRFMCSVALFRLWMIECSTAMKHAAKLIACRSVSYSVPTIFEISTCKAPHYDLWPEAIYRLSAARACVSVLALERYRRYRLESAAVVTQQLGESLLVSATAATAHGPPFVSLREAATRGETRQFPFPLKAPYAVLEEPDTCAKCQFAVKLTAPWVRYVVRLASDRKECAARQHQSPGPA